MAASYAIVVRPEIDLLHMTLAGFFDRAELAAFDHARRAAHGQLRCGASQHDALVDVSEMRLQAQDIFEAFRSMIADRATRARRLAFVTGDAAIRMQVRRVVDREAIRGFADLASAKAWLAEPPQGLALAG